LRRIVVAAATLVTAAVVASSGQIRWVGLIVRYIARMLVGPGFARLLPTAMPLGAAYLLLVDIAARSLATVETPLGIPPPWSAPPSSFGCWRAAARLGLMRLEAISLGFGNPGHAVGHDLELSVGPGKVFCPLGHNGSGKTTLFLALLSLIPPRPARCGWTEGASPAADARSRSRSSMSVKSICLYHAGYGASEPHCPPRPFVRPSRANIRAA
jgi:ABC-type multidrug transport system fused ATPase/permease subunit